jgi:hypothetical protein
VFIELEKLDVRIADFLNQKPMKAAMDAGVRNQGRARKIYGWPYVKRPRVRFRQRKSSRMGRDQLLVRLLANEAALLSKNKDPGAGFTPHELEHGNCSQSNGTV